MLVAIVFVAGCQENASETAVVLEKAPKKIAEVIAPDLTLQMVSTKEGQYVVYYSTKDVEMAYEEDPDFNRSLILTESTSNSDERKMYIYKIPKVKVEDRTFTVYINGELVPFDMNYLLGMR